MRNIKLFTLATFAFISINLSAVDCVVSNTTAVSETFADGTVLYSIDSDGRVNSSTKFGGNKDIIVNGSKTKGAALVDKRFAIKFPVAVTSVEIYGYNSSSGRALSKISTSQTMAKSSYTEITSSTTKNSSSSTPNYSYTFTASWSTAIAANTAIWFEFSNSCNFYKISYTGDGGSTPPVTPTVSSVAVSPTSKTLDINGTQQLTATVTATPSTADKTVTWSTSDAAVATVSTTGLVTAIGQGSATITATSNLDNTKSGTCAITVNAPAAPIPVTAISLDATASVSIGATTTLTVTYTPANANEGKAVSWSSANGNIATVDANGVVTGVAEGTVAITATSTTDPAITASCNVTVTAGPPVPYTDLNIHMPMKYEKEKSDGGYGGNLSISGGREYEVYYCSYDSSSNLSVTVMPTQKKVGVCTPVGETEVRAADYWFKGTADGTKSNYTFAGTEEFVQGAGAMHKFKNGNTYTFHVQGFDQFSFLGKDNNADPTKGRHFEVYVDDVLQPMTVANTATIRRFTLTTGEHVIRLKAIHDGDSNSELYGFSFRLPQEPKTEWLKGDDSAQVVLQTTAMKPVTYVTKYNNIPGAETRLEWVGNAATGIDLTTIVGTLTDTLVLGGTANCPTGLYEYDIVAYYNNVEKNRVRGKFTVSAEIKALTATKIESYQNEDIDEIKFNYIALSENNVTFTWENATPAGITASGANGIFTISGTPTQAGTYGYIISVEGGNSIKDTIVVVPLDLGSNPIMYLHKNDKSYDRDGIYQYLKSSAGGSLNLIHRKTQAALRSADQYANYKWILISEDVDANNPEVLAVARGEANKPVLNMKSFAYMKGRLDWGEPDNGSVTMEEGRFITVWRNDHPIFQGKNKGDKIQILDTVVGRGLMPVAVSYDSTLCLATARTRDIEDYHADGPAQTFLHEVQADKRNGHKYICMPIGISSSNHLTAAGKNLLRQVITYLTGTAQTVALPALAINSFKIGNYTGQIDNTTNIITVEIQAKDSDAMKAAKPEITLASPMTFAAPDPIFEAKDGSVDFSNWSYGVKYTVSDYVTKRYYHVYVKFQRPQGLENIDYQAGQWINIFDIYGRKISTTNEDLFTMDLPRGMYVVVTENGESFKIIR